MKERVKNIPASIVRQAVYNFCDKEGNRSEAVPFYLSLLKKESNELIFKEFMDACKKYHVDYYISKIEGQPGQIKTIVTLNGYDYLEMQTTAREDITLPLATAIVNTLSLAFDNEKALKNLQNK